MAAGLGASASAAYGQKARDLVMELKGVSQLPSYKDEVVRAVFQEIAALDQVCTDLVLEREDLPSDEGLKVPAVAFNASIERNKRLLIFYHARRCELIEDLRWRYGATGLPREVAEKLSSREADYLRDYGDNLMQFVEEMGIDITADLQPPREEYVEVVARFNCGRLMTLSGPREVKASEVHFVRKVDAEPLIRSGVLVHQIGK